MRTALLCLICLIGMAPVVLFLDGPLTLGIWSAVLAAALVVVGTVLRPGEATHLGMLVRPVAIAVAIPAILMVLQAVPMPSFSRLPNPTWESAADALGQPLTGSISIDTGSTLLSLCRYLAWLAVALLAGALTIDRQRAERVLLAATAASVLIAALLIVNDAAGLAWLDQASDGIARGGALDAAALGAILSAACAVRAYERFETRRADRSAFRLAQNVAACIAGLAVCATAIALGDPGNALFAAAAGLGTLLGVVLVRRLGLGLGGALAIAAVGCLLAVGIGTERGQSGSDVTLRFAAQSSPSMTITRRMLADSPWTGTGAGTYHDLVPIYRGFDDLANVLDPPSVAAQIALEWGQLLLWAAVLAAAALIVMLLRAALRRGRDSFYSAAGASALVALLISAFGNAGLFGTSVLILTGTVLGLAVAQSRSRTQ